MSYRESKAPEPLTNLVTGFWEFTVDSPTTRNHPHHVPPDGCVSLVIQYTQTARMLLLVGPRCSPLVVPVASGEHYFGVRFWPHAAASVLGPKIEQGRDYVGPANFMLAERTKELLAVLPRSPDPQAVRRGFATALGKMPVAPETDLARLAVEAIVRTDGKISIADIAEQLDVSQRHLQRVFRNSTGLTPKEFSRIRRFRSAAAELLRQSPRAWVEVAYESGFSDQPHMVREFTQLVGLTAEELREEHRHINHIDVDP